MALEHGLKKASELTEVPYATVRQWESRRKRRAIKQAKTIITQAGVEPVTVSQSPTIALVADNLAKELQENGKETKLSLSRSARRMAKDAELANLKHSPYVHKVAQIAATVNPELYAQDKGTDPSKIAVNIAILGT